MTEPVTPNKGFTIPNTGDLVNTWGPVVNGNFGLIDALLGSSTTITVSSGSVTLTTPQTQNYRIALTGTLAGAVSVIVPAKAGFYTFYDVTVRGSSVFPISITTGSTYRAQNIPSGMSQVYCDGQNVLLLTTLVIGEMKACAAASVPPLYLPCNGSAVSRTTYVDLFNTIGSTFGSGDGSTTFNLPDLRGRAPFAPDAFGGSAAAGRLSSASGFGSTAIGTAGGSELLTAHNHTLTDPGHTHTVTDPGHNHTQNPHAHTITDPGHAHTDSGHIHTVGNTSTSLQGGSSPVGVFGSGATENTGTGFAQIQTSVTGIAVNTNTASNNAAVTGVTNQSATTGITVNNAGAGGSQNMPPALLVPWIIYAGQ